MSPRKRIDAPTLDIGGAKIGEPDPETIVDTDASSRGTPSQPDFDPREELRALRKQIDSLRQQVSAAAQVVKGSAKQAARQTEATVKLYPVSTLVVVAVVSGAFAFTIAGLRAAPPRSRAERVLDEMRALYDRMRDRS